MLNSNHDAALIRMFQSAQRGGDSQSARIAETLVDLAADASMAARLVRVFDENPHLAHAFQDVNIAARLTLSPSRSSTAHIGSDATPAM